MSAPPLASMTIAVVGLGHVGLPTAVGLAELGWSVFGADDDHEKSDVIRRGQAPFYEPGLEELLRTHLATGRLQILRDVSEAMGRVEVIFVCVGTPQHDDGSADLSQVETVARAIARSLNGYKLIVEKSTTPVWTARMIKRTMLEHEKGSHDFDVAVNPEFLREGSAVHDFFNPDRIVLGVESTRARDLLLQIYEPLVERLERQGGDGTGRDRVLVTGLDTAELIKHASNAFLATKISFINLVADMCEATGADVMEVARGLGMDPRIGPAFLRAGVGFGGYCFPKDLRAFTRIGQDLGVDVSFLGAVERINESRIDGILHKVRKVVRVISGHTIAVLGLAFKPSTDDIREAPSLKIIARLLAEGAALQLHDPQAMERAREVYPEDRYEVRYCNSPYDAARSAHALLLVTEWDEYRNLDLAKVRRLMAAPVIIDGRNLFAAETVRALGFEYVSVGRP